MRVGAITTPCTSTWQMLQVKHLEWGCPFSGNGWVSYLALCTRLHAAKRHGRHAVGVHLLDKLSALTFHKLFALILEFLRLFCGVRLYHPHLRELVEVEPLQRLRRHCHGFHSDTQQFLMAFPWTQSTKLSAKSLRGNPKLQLDWCTYMQTAAVQYSESKGLPTPVFLYAKLLGATFKL